VAGRSENLQAKGSGLLLTLSPDGIGSVEAFLRLLLSEGLEEFPFCSRHAGHALDVLVSDRLDDCLILFRQRCFTTTVAGMNSISIHHLVLFKARDATAAE